MAIKKTINTKKLSNKPLLFQTSIDNTIEERIAAIYQETETLDVRSSNSITSTSNFTPIDSKSISNLPDTSKIKKAAIKYKDELANAYRSYISDDMLVIVNKQKVSGQDVLVTHVVLADGSQINGAPANGSYGNGLEKATDAAKRLNCPLVINGSHFTSSGKEDLKGANHVAIVDGQIKTDGRSGGQELLLDKNGRIYNSYNSSATDLVNNGVKYSFACHSTQVIENGDISHSYNEPRSYKRTTMGQTQDGEYYIVTDMTYNNVLSNTAQFLKSKGCVNAYSLDQGGSVSLVLNGELLNNPSDSSGERAVGDFITFSDLQQV